MAERGPVSRIAAGLEASPIRRMAPWLARSEVISLAGGVPDPATFPADELAAAASAVLAKEPGAALQYGPTRGEPRLLDRLAERVESLGLASVRERLFVTTGSQQALDLVARLLVDPGDTIVVETPTYAGALSAFRAAGARLEALDSGGPAPDPGAIGRAVERARRAGSSPRALYLLPNFQNPSGTSLAPEIRPALVAAAERAGLFVIEDDPYRELWFDEPPALPLAAGDGPAGERVIYLGSLSKVLAPGLRLGFVVVPTGLAERFERLKEAADLCTGSLSQAVARELIEAGALGARLERIRALYRARRDALVGALDATLTGVASFTRPRGGFFCWVEAPGIDAEAVLERALRSGVAFVAGRLFHAGGGGENTLRLAFSKEPEARLGEAIARLAPLIAEVAAGRGRGRPAC